MSINELISDAIAHWLEWVEDGAPTFGAFSRHEGLCGTLNHYLMRAVARGEISEADGEKAFDSFSNYMSAMIMDPGSEQCSGASPFCEPRTFFHAVQLGTCHKNPKRIAFAREVQDGLHDFEAGYVKR